MPAADEGIIVQRGKHRAQVTYEPSIDAYAWWCCFDEELGDMWDACDTLNTCLVSLRRHLHRPAGTPWSEPRIRLVEPRAVEVST